jgi:hypothetical protein
MKTLIDPYHIDRLLPYRIGTVYIFFYSENGSINARALNQPIGKLWLLKKFSEFNSLRSAVNLVRY